MAVGASSVTIPRQPDDDARTATRTGPRGPIGMVVESWAGVLSLLPIGLLALAAALGRFVRPGADEWCFLPYVRDHGISGLTGKFYFTDNGRIANGWLVGLYAKPGVAGHQWYGLVSGVLMLALLWAVTALGLRRAGVLVPRGMPLLVASMTAAVFLFASANTYKTFYWPAASVSHTLAPVLACAAAIPPLLARSRHGRIAALGAAAVAGVFLGTLSEETSVVVLVVLSALVLIAGRLFTERVRRQARSWAVATMAGVAAGVLLLVTSPGSRHRREKFGAGTSMLDPHSLAASLGQYEHILGTVLTTWQYTGAVAAGLLLGIAARGRAGQVLLPCRPLLTAGAGVLALLVSGYLCTVITYPVFGRRVVVTERTWNDYLLLFVLLLVGIGALLGRELRTRRPRAVAVLAAVICAAACVSLAAPLDALGRRMEVRAQQWDRQDHWLREQSARHPGVLPYKPLHIARMLEPFGSKPGGWPAVCVARYYHVPRITESARLP
ncbi:DUF6056 family protein [Streptomyces sp. NBC_00344]|uniref:DUF6056 family protein n=1 Tax=Streptomyces sp. NBC_00344 TaxID=2975720 RepID=UPI002E2409CB